MLQHGNAFAITRKSYVGNKSATRRRQAWRRALRSRGPAPRANCPTCPSNLPAALSGVSAPPAGA